MTPDYRWHIALRYHGFDKDAWVTGATFADVMTALLSLYQEADGLPITINIQRRVQL